MPESPTDRVLRVVRRTAGLPRGLTWGPGSRIHHTVRVEGRGVLTGADCRLQRDVFLRGPEVVLGDRVFCNDGVYINHHVTIEDDVSIGQGTRLITGDHELGSSAHRAGRTSTAPIRIGRGAWLGAGVTVLPGVTIGAGCVIAAGAIVTADCAPDQMYAGVPAVAKKPLDD